MRTNTHALDCGFDRQILGSSLQALPLIAPLKRELGVPVVQAFAAHLGKSRSACVCVSRSRTMGACSRPHGLGGPRKPKPANEPATNFVVR